MKRTLMFSLAVVALALTGCPSQTFFPTCDDPAHPCPPVEPDYPETDVDGVETQIGMACRSLRRAGCAEGYPDARTKRTCYQRVQSESAIVKVPAACLMTAQNADAVRACGTKDTLRFRCAAAKVSP